MTHFFNTQITVPMSEVMNLQKRCYTTEKYQKDGQPVPSPHQRELYGMRSGLDACRVSHQVEVV